MDLIRDDREPPGEAELRQALELLAAPHAPHRIVRVAEQEDARPWGERVLERLEVDVVASARGPRQVGRVQRDPDVPRYAEQRRIEGDLQEHAVPRRGDRATGHVEARDDAGDQHHRVGLDAPAVELLKAVGEESVERRRLEVVPVAEDADRLQKLYGWRDRKSTRL